MLGSYLSLSGESETRKVIEKSKFITTSRRVCGESEAREFIAEISARYKDATHNCYAYIADNLGNFLRFSDDGEPQGTAGMPMLEAIKNNNLKEVCVVCTRYFGGIKLGAGGLVRAYSGCTAENLAAAKRVSFEPCAESRYIVDYPSVDAALRFFSENGGSVLRSEYSSGAEYTVAVKKSKEEAFNSSLLNALNGKVKIEKIREYYFPFDI